NRAGRGPPSAILRPRDRCRRTRTCPPPASGGTIAAPTRHLPRRPSTPPAAAASGPHRRLMTGLYTDLYEVRMAASYLRRDMTGPATFSLFSRRLPASRGFLVAAGLADVLDFLAGFHFDDEEIDYLRHHAGLDEASLAALQEMRFTGDVWAVPEGRVVFADEPLLEVTA